jgi:hypothetical protein
MSRRFTADELKWDGSWGLTGPVADTVAFRVPPWWELGDEAKHIIMVAQIKQKIEFANFTIARLKENVVTLDKVLSTMKTKR